MIATVVMNLSGLMTGVLQLFLRSNTTTSSFRSKNCPDVVKGHEIRLWGPNELGFGGHLLQPVSGPEHNDNTDLERLVNEKEGRLSSESAQDMSYTKTKYYQPESIMGLNTQNMPMIPEPTAVGLSTMSPTRNSGKPRERAYSLFPGNVPNPNEKASGALTVPSAAATTQAPARTPATGPTFLSPSSRDVTTESIYTIGDLVVPPPLFADQTYRSRTFSTASSATVQIGMRISHAPPQAPTPSTLPLPSTTYMPPTLHTSTFAFPFSGAPKSPSVAAPPFTRSPSPAPSAAYTVFSTSSSRAASPAPGTESSVLGMLLREERDTRMKALPPTPRRSPSPLANSEEVERLSPSVYSPTLSTASLVPNLAPTVYNPAIKKDAVAAKPRFIGEMSVMPKPLALGRGRSRSGNESRSGSAHGSGSGREGEDNGSAGDGWI